jgi:hypothetical protein
MISFSGKNKGHRAQTVSFTQHSTPAVNLIGLSTLEHIWKDIEEIIVPSWVSKIPTDFGSPRHGKLKADQWRSAALVYMPIALVHVWSRTNFYEQSEHYDAILRNTLVFLQAVEIVTRRKISAEDAKAYTGLMGEYLAGLRQLFPDKKLRPSHHFSLHLEEFLLKYGPVHGWWAFPFERVIQVLQTTNTNHQISKGVVPSPRPD